MTKSELKQAALDAMNQAGAAMQDGRYQEAKDMAEKAWNCYYELQKQRVEDEDFTDLIYWARGLYEQAEAAIVAQPAAEDTQGEYDPAVVYQCILKLASLAQGGDAEAAIEAARRYMDPRNWTYLDERGVDYIGEAAHLIQGVLNNDSASPRMRALDAIEGAKLFSLPMFNNVNIDNAIIYAKYAAGIAITDNELTKDEIYDIITTTSNLVLTRDELPYAYALVQEGLEKGLDKGLLNPIFMYGCRKQQPWAKELEDQMYEAGTWQGMLQHGITLLDNYINYEENTDENYKALSEYNKNDLSKFADEHAGTPGGDACTGLACFIAFHHLYIDFLNEEDLVSMITASADNFSDWANYYLGRIYDASSWGIKEDNPDDPRVEEYRNNAFKYYGVAAGLGHRSAIYEYIQYLKADPGEKALLDKYLDIARQLNIDPD